MVPALGTALGPVVPSSGYAGRSQPKLWDWSHCQGGGAGDTLVSAGQGEAGGESPSPAPSKALLHPRCTAGCGPRAISAALAASRDGVQALCWIAP